MTVQGNGGERVVEVYHATTGAKARAILDGAPFEPSGKLWNWLGSGTYFWEGDSARALQWAVDRFGAAGAVLKTRVSLAGCLDLTQLNWAEYVAPFHDEVRAEYHAKKRDMPKNTGDDHDLDCTILNHIYDTKWKYRSVRAAFRDGEVLYEGSAFYRLTHVEISVRDPGAIVGPTEPEVLKIVWPKE